MKAVTKGFVFEPFMYGGKVPTPDDIKRIIRKVGVAFPDGMLDGNVENPKTGMIERGLIDREEALLQRLVRTLSWTGYRQVERRKQPPNKAEKAFTAITKAVVALKAALQVNHEVDLDHPNEWDLLNREIWEPLMHAYTVQRHEHGALRDVLNSLARLERWASLAKDVSSHRKRPSRHRHRGDQHITDLFGGLAGTWLEVWGRVPRVDDKGYVRFCNAVLSFVGLRLSKAQFQYRLSKVSLPKKEQQKKSRSHRR